MGKPKKIRLTAVPFDDGFEFRWLDDDGNEYQVELAESTDMHVNLNPAPISLIGKKNKSYVAEINMIVPFRQRGIDA